ncbi:type I secretion system permease/ATPase, partial [Rhizobium ruizarguesonis]
MVDIQTAPDRDAMAAEDNGERSAVPDAAIADSGLAAISAVAGYFRIASRPETLSRELALTAPAARDDLLRVAKIIGLKART